MNTILGILNNMLGMVPGFTAGHDNGLQVFAFWLLLLVVPLFSVLAVIGVRSTVAQRYRALLQCFPALAGTTYRQLFEAGQVRVRAVHFVAPLVFLFLLNAFLVIILIADPPEPDGLIDAKHYLMLCGQRCVEPTGDGAAAADVLAFRQYQTGTMVVLGNAFLGWICWALVTIFDRSTSMQILPTTFRKITIRLALASLVAIALRHVMPDMPAVLIGFGVGMFPQRGVVFLESAFNKLVQSTARSEELGLELIQGISHPVVFRLQEIGIDDAVGLAHANPFTLYDASGYSMTEIIDWIGQAQLLVVAQAAGFAALQQAGIRTLFDVAKALQTGSALALPDGSLLAQGGLRPEQFGTRAEYLRLAEVYRGIGSVLPVAGGADAGVADTGVADPGVANPGVTVLGVAA